MVEITMPQCPHWLQWDTPKLPLPLPRSPFQSSTPIPHLITLTTPNGIQIQSFPQITHQTDQQTERQTDPTDGLGNKPVPTTTHTHTQPFYCWSGLCQQPLTLYWLYSNADNNYVRNCHKLSPQTDHRRLAASHVVVNNSTESGEFGMNNAGLLMLTVNTEQFTTDLVHHRSVCHTASEQ